MQTTVRKKPLIQKIGSYYLNLYTLKEVLYRESTSGVKNWRLQAKHGTQDTLMQPACGWKEVRSPYSFTTILLHNNRVYSVIILNF